MHPMPKLLGACQRGWQVSLYGGSCRLCFAINVASLRRCVRQKIFALGMKMPHCEKGKGRSHATTQRKSASDGLYGNGQIDKSG